MRLIEVEFESFKRPEAANPWEQEERRPISEYDPEDLEAVVTQGLLNIDEITFVIRLEDRVLVTLKDETTLTVVSTLKSFMGQIREELKRPM